MELSQVMVASTTTASERACRFKEYREKKTKLAQYVNSGLYLEGMTDIQKRIIRRQAKNHMYDDARDELYYTGSKGQLKRKVVMHEDEALEILQLCHISPTGGHRGINTTLSTISMNYMWNGMKHDTSEFIRSCEYCQGFPKVTCKKQAPAMLDLKVVEPTEPMELVGMSLTGPLPTTHEDYKYVLSFVDYFTKFVEFFPLKSIETTSVASCVRRFVWRWGAPKQFLSDQGPEIVAEINSDLRQMLEIDRSIISTNHPRKKNLDNSIDHTLTTHLSKLVHEHQEDWADYLDRVAFTMRTQTESVTRHTPFFLMFGRRPRTVLEMDPAQCIDDNRTLDSRSEEIGTENLDDAVFKRENVTTDTESTVNPLKVNQNVVSGQIKLKKTFQRRKSGGATAPQLRFANTPLYRKFRIDGRKGGQLQTKCSKLYRYGGDQGGTS